MTKEDLKQDLIVPRWFIYLATVFMIGAVPWGAFVTNGVYQFPAVRQQSNENKADIKDNSEKIASGVRDHAAHTASFAKFSAVFDEMFRRLDRMEGKLDEAAK